MAVPLGLLLTQQAGCSLGIEPEVCPAFVNCCLLLAGIWDLFTGLHQAEQQASCTVDFRGNSRASQLAHIQYSSTNAASCFSSKRGDSGDIRSHGNKHRRYGININHKAISVVDSQKAGNKMEHGKTSRTHITQAGSSLKDFYHQTSSRCLICSLFRLEMLRRRQPKLQRVPVFLISWDLQGESSTEGSKAEGAVGTTELSKCCGTPAPINSSQCNNLSYIFHHIGSTRLATSVRKGSCSALKLDRQAWEFFAVISPPYPVQLKHCIFT